MRILFLSDNFPPETNAPATRLLEHSRRWVAAGHSVTVITCAPNFPQGKVHPGYTNAWRTVEDFDGVRVVRVKTYITANEGVVRRTLDYLSFMASSVVAGLFEQHPDVVVATSPQFFCAVGGWMLSRFKRRPYVFELRDLWPASIMAVGAMRKGRFIHLLEALELFLYRAARRVIPVTHAFRRDLVERGIDPEKIRVVMNGVDLDIYAPAPKDPSFVAELELDTKFVVGYLGTHGMAHGLEYVVEAATLLRDDPGIIFLFAGAGAERRTVERMVRERGLPNVRLLPSQPKQVMPKLWSVCDLALISLRDTPVFETVVPSKLFEAMGMGIPVLAAIPKGETSQIVERTGAGLHVPPEDPARLSAAIVSLREAPDQLSTMRTAALEAATAYSRDAQARRFLAVLDEIIPTTG